jgi:isopenicillin N synthase-like dioxygenase
MEIENKQGHRYGEDAITEGGYAFDTMASQSVVVRYHSIRSPVARAAGTMTRSGQRRPGLHNALGREGPATMTDAIPVIDVADYLAGRAGALQALARQLHDALTTVGFMVITGHDVPQALIEQTFEEAERLHDMPMGNKLALKLNEHNNGYMAMGRYAVWTSDVNKNDKGDLNEAFFIKRERAPDDPLRQSGRRFVGANVWPAEAELPEFRARALDYADTMDAFTRRMLPALAVALELPPDWFDEAFRQSQFTLRLSHYPPGRPLRTSSASHRIPTAAS